VQHRSEVQLRTSATVLHEEIVLFKTDLKRAKDEAQV
jgi:hypothetical protein